MPNFLSSSGKGTVLNLSNIWVGTLNTPKLSEYNMKHDFMYLSLTLRFRTGDSELGLGTVGIQNWQLCPHEFPCLCSEKEGILLELK